MMDDDASGGIGGSSSNLTRTAGVTTIAEAAASVDTRHAAADLVTKKRDRQNRRNKEWRVRVRRTKEERENTPPR